MTIRPSDGYGPSALLTPANVVTLSRIAVAPVAFALILSDGDQSSWALTALWFVLSASDLIDGRLARAQGATRSGAFLDPLADKVLAIGGIGSMWLAGRFALLPLALIVIREVVISIFRSRYARQGLAVPATTLAKWKTFLQLAAVGWVVLPLTRDVPWLADVTLWVGVAVGLISGASYLRAGNAVTSSMEAG